MFRRLSVARYKCLQRVEVTFRPFNILIGPNASGKSTLLDSLTFLHDALVSDVDHAVRQRAGSLRELVWRQAAVEQGFEIAVEAPLPASLGATFDVLRYEVRIALDAHGALSVGGENLWLIDDRQLPSSTPKQARLFPADASEEMLRHALVRPGGSRTPPGYRLVVRKNVESGNNYFRSERTDWNLALRFAAQRLALSGIPEDEERFPAALWFKQKLLRGLHVIQLNSVLMRRACPADAPRTFQADGSNLPILVRLLQEQPARFEAWVAHVRTILKDLHQIYVVERPEDRALYLVLEYTTGLRVPAWLLSDGTLRLLALTLLAYLSNTGEIYIIEEPENGVHPRALEAVFQSLSSVYEGQVFVATHSPLLLRLARLEDLLVCGKTDSGAMDVVNGPEHPRLKQWQRDVPLDTLFVAGVLE